MNRLKLGSRKKLKVNLRQIKIRQQLKIYGTGRAVLKGKFLATQTYCGKQEKSQIHNLTLHLKQNKTKTLGKKATVRRRNTSIKTTGEINGIEAKKEKEKQKPRVCSLKRYTRLTNL